MILSNALVVDETFQPRKQDISIENGVITGVSPYIPGEYRIDCSDCYLLPGFIDTHIHGAVGHMVSADSTDAAAIAAFAATQGVTGLCLTTDAEPIETLEKQFAAIAQAAATASGSKIWGIHAEGPFLNRKRKGGMNPKHIFPPDVDALRSLHQAGRGLLKLMTVAADVEGILPLIREAVQLGLQVSIGHTDAAFATAKAAFDAGATRATHLFNAMRPLHHREPGILGAALTDDRITCEMICDHVHLHPAMLDIILRCKGEDRVTIVSDSVYAAGADFTEYTSGGVKYTVADGAIYMSDGTICGSARTMLNGVQNLLRSGVAVGTVAKLASYNPARALGIESLTGSIAPGKRADLVLLDAVYGLRATWVGGECVFGKENMV